MDNIYLRMTNMPIGEMLGRIQAAVVYLADCASTCPSSADNVMKNILDGAGKVDAYGRVCALIGYVTGEIYRTDNQKLVYEMVTGEKPEETKKA